MPHPPNSAGDRSRHLPGFHTTCTNASWRTSRGAIRDVACRSDSRTRGCAARRWRYGSPNPTSAISGYHAHLDAKALLFATMRAEDRETVDAFEQAVVTAIPQVLQAQRLFSYPDQVLRIITRDLPAYQ